MDGGRSLSYDAILALLRALDNEDLYQGVNAQLEDNNPSDDGDQS